MVMLPQSPIGNNVDEVIAQAGNGALPLIPDDTYKAIIVKSELKETSKGGQFLALTVVLTEGKYKGTEFIERLNIVNKSDVAVKIAFETMARIAKSVGLSTMPTSSDALHNKPLMVKTTTEAGTPWINKDGVQQEGKDKSVLDAKGYVPVPKVGISSNEMPTADSPTLEVSAKMPWE